MALQGPYATASIALRVIATSKLVLVHFLIKHYAMNT
jgi:hypothetical protein